MTGSIEKLSIISGLMWKTFERGGVLGIQFVVQIILARLLLPEEYGLIALAIIFIYVGDVFIQSGFSTSLIQKKDATDTDFSSVFFLGIIASALLYIILFLAAPLIGNFYKEPELVFVLRILGVSLFFGAISSVQNAFICRNMQFRRLFFSSLGGVIISGITGITLAYLGFGIWALVAQQLTNKITNAIILWFTVKWRPKLLFSMQAVKALFDYGWKILFAGLLDTLYTNIYGLVIGRIYDPKMLGLYSRGEQFPKYTITFINGSISEVLFPALSNNQKNRDKLKKMVRKSIMSSSFIVLPLMFGLAACADPLIKILLTEAWVPAIPFMQILCFSYALWPIHTANLQVIKALGYSGTYLKLEIVKKVIGIAVLLMSIPFGIYVMVLFISITSIICTFINGYPNKALINYSYIEQWKDIMPSLFISIVMGAVVYTFNFLSISTWQILMLQIIVGVTVYIGLAKIFKVESFEYLLVTIKDILKSRKEISL